MASTETRPADLLTQLGKQAVLPSTSVPKDTEPGYISEPSGLRAGRMDGVKALAAKHAGLRLTPQTHLTERTASIYCPLTSIDAEYMYASMQTCVHAHT